MGIFANKYKIICFDYYGTLVKAGQPFISIKQWIADNVNNVLPVYSHMLRYYAKLSTDDHYIGGEERLILSLQYAANKMNISFDKDAYRIYINSLFISPPVYHDANQTIRQLRQKFKVGITSNADNRIIKASIEKNQLYFDFIITSEDAQADKPAKRFFSYVEEQLNFPKDQILIVGDSWKDDIWGAHGYGFDSIWIDREKKQYEKEEVLSASVVDSLSDIIRILNDNTE